MSPLPGRDSPLSRAGPVVGLELDRAYRLLTEQAAGPLPGDIPVYPGYTMSQPVLVASKENPAQKWNLVGAMARQKGLVPRKIADYYQQKLGAAGWTSDGPEGGGTSFTLKMQKGERTVCIEGYSGICGDTDEYPDPRGTNLQILY